MMRRPNKSPCKGDGTGFNGRDKLGPFVMRSSVPCGVCGKQVMCSVHYERKPLVSEYVSKAKSLLLKNKKTGKFIRTVGINCGCYAKVHRQIKAIEMGRG